MTALLVFNGNIDLISMITSDYKFYFVGKVWDK